MKILFQSLPSERQTWYKKARIWIFSIVLLLVLAIIILTALLLFRRTRKNNATHIHYTRVNTNIYPGGYELYRLNILPTRNPEKQYKLLADFLRISLFNKSTYEKILPSCPVIYSMSSTDHPEDWRGMLFGTSKYPQATMPYPYICYLSVIPTDRRHQLGSILLNQFINEMSQESNPPITHMQLHTNWENCPAQKLYHRCGFRCNEFTPNGYSKPFEAEYQFGHMIRMELNLANIKDISKICSVTDAVKISSDDENNYTNLCTQSLPNGLNRSCTAAG